MRNKSNAQVGLIRNLYNLGHDGVIVGCSLRTEVSCLLLLNEFVLPVWSKTTKEDNVIILVRGCCTDNARQLTEEA